MTNEEAIEILNKIMLTGDFTDEYGDMINTEPYDEAINLAIKSVKAVKLLDDLLVIKRDGIYRPIKNTTKEECYKAIYEMSKIMADLREADNDKMDC